MSQQFDVVVIGGGIVGLTAALAMVLRGFSVAVIDAGKMDVNLAAPDPRVYAINQASEDLLQELGVWEQLDPSRVSPYRHMYVWDASSSAHIEFDARIVATDHLGTIIEESMLKHALLQVLSRQERKLTFFAHTTVSAVESAEPWVKVSADQESWEAKLLMIADGGNSPCRKLLNVPLTTWPYHQQALVALVNTEKSHQQTAWQVFNVQGPLAFLPMVNEKQCSIVWSINPAHANKLMALTDEEFNCNLTAAFAGKLGAVKLAGKRLQFPLTHAPYETICWLPLAFAR